MVQINGIPILADIAIGRIRVYQEPQSASETGRGEAFERSRLERALAQVGERLGQLYEKALRETGEEEAAILEIHQMLLEDEDFQDAVNERLAEGCSAEYAVRQAGEDIAQMFSKMDDNMKARAADIRDVASRLVRILSGTGDLELTEPAILMAEDLAPSTTIQLDRSKLLGFVTKGGSVNSHTAILSRTLNIPALVQAHIQPEWDGKLAVIDGVNGVLYVDPNQEILSAMNQVKAQIQQRRCQLQELKGKKAITKDGRSVLIYANVGSLYEVELALENDAEGIGLFRSEFLYLNREELPTEEEQYQIYRKTLELMDDRRVIVRTMDIGADKKADYLHLDAEENPALGYRAIRICLDRTDVFRTQLRALLRAAVHGNLSIMYPMIASLDEVLEIREIVQSVYEELRSEHIPCRMVEQGIMIETPAAAIMSDQLAPYVDFFSIGTNDLTQYTLVADRQNARLARYSDPRHPAVLRLIRRVVEEGHKAGIWVGICGELGADPALTGQFLEMGIDELSAAPGSVLGLRAHVRELDLAGGTP